MHRLEVTTWAARLGHLLVTERFGFSEVRFPGDVPVAARSRTARHLGRMGQDAIDAVCESWPGLTTLPIWTSFQRTLIEQPDLGPTPRPMSRRSPLEICSPSGEPPNLLDQLLQRLAYLHDEEEFQGPAFALLTLSDAWRTLRHDVDNLYGNLLEAYIDAPSDTVRMIVRFSLCTTKVIDQWRSIEDHELFEGFAKTMDRQPEWLATAPPEQIDRLWRIGALSPKFMRLGMMNADRVLPLERVPSGHFVQHPLHVPALVTMSPVLGFRRHLHD